MAQTIVLQLSVIIVNYNVKFFLEQCLCSVLRAAKDLALEIIVVDNHSTDGSKKYLTDRFPIVHFIWLNENIGFGRANNHALELAKGEYILFLNPDTIVPENAFSLCLDFFKSHSNAGGLGVKMIDGQGKFLKESKRGFPSLLTSMFKLSGLTSLFPQSKVFAKYYLGNLAVDEVHTVDVLSGAFMMAPKKILNMTGGFDEAFFMYGEDVDLSYRIQQAGFTNYYFPLTTIIHFKGESTTKLSRQYLQHFYGAMKLFVEKHYGRKQASLYKLFINAGMAVKAFASGLKPVSSKQNDQSVSHNKVIIVGDETDYSLIQSSLQIKQSSLTTSLTDLQTMINESNEPLSIVYCEGNIAVKDFIAFMNRQQKQLLFFFHFAGSNSIVSSFTKDSPGLGIQIIKPLP